jgi:hypothetical membrane protein
MNIDLPRSRFAGAFWLLAGLLYLSCETIAAFAFPGYSYAYNYISDLGVPYPGTIDGRMLNSPMAMIMNLGGFILNGILFAAAAVAARCAIRRAVRIDDVFLLLAIVHSVGIILVGTVHSGPREVAAGIHFVHVIGAGMVIVGGNAALIAAAIASSRFHAPAIYCKASLTLGIFGLLALAVLEIEAFGHPPILPAGLLERASAYPITIWEIATGFTLVAARRRRR